MAEISVEQHFPEELRQKYEFHQWKHACAILKSDFQNEWKDILALLKVLRLKKTWINEPGGRKTKLASWFDEFLFARGWCEKKFETSVIVDENRMDSPTHKIDCYKNRIALELEWNNKDPFFDRDLNNFRLLFDLRAISVGIIVTRCDELQELFDSLNRGKAYGTSTTHMSKLLPRIEGGGGSGCPILVIGIKKNLYAEDE
jgi:hypothetical protein